MGSDGLPERLERASKRAIAVLDEAQQESNDDPDLVNLHRMRNEAAKTLANLKARVDEAGLKMKQEDNLAGLMQLVLAKKAQLAREREEE